MAYGVLYETNAYEGFKGHAESGEIGAMPLRELATLLLLGGIVNAILSENWGIGAIVFSLGVVVLGLDRLRVAQGRPDCAIGWVLVLVGALTIMFTAIRMVIGVT